MHAIQVDAAGEWGSSSKHVHDLDSDTEQAPLGNDRQNTMACGISVDG